ncbi:hypothetical protein JD844_005568 [Phrynosoma platyrhinos]|uniref:Sphingomyelin phosphodiesterase C-terminal domain-containing protein n=1 Tax=Phrynosoma platyrhinos TaxID=52577 RepID=A0ABQ7TNA3_PHRPL|nr:hypothetical protein JD844_005568 [Phrynosoma platyrhinos]
MRAATRVYIIGHVPPGFFEKKRSKAWFRERFNQQYTEIIQKHHGVIVAQFFGHHHTDSFRMFYSNSGSPINVMFLSPAVTPWKTTLPGVHNGANNPGIRVFTYDRDTLQVEDMVTHYLNLTQANQRTPEWKKEYSLTEAFQIRDASVQSMHLLLEKLEKDQEHLQRYYQYNSVQYDLSYCDDNCQTDHLCAIREVDFAKYSQCIQARSAAAAPSASMLYLVSCCCILRLIPIGLWGTLGRLGHEQDLQKDWAFILELVNSKFIVLTARIGDIEDTANAALEQGHYHQVRIQELEEMNDYLANKVQDLEDRNRHLNIRICGIPEQEKRHDLIPPYLPE